MRRIIPGCTMSVPGIGRPRHPLSAALQGGSGRAESCGIRKTSGPAGQVGRDDS
jgi:hypothetical protein